MKSFDIEIETYGTKKPFIVESQVIDAAIETGILENPDAFMHFGDFENIEAAKQHHANVAADEAYCKTHDC